MKLGISDKGFQRLARAVKGQEFDDSEFVPNDSEDFNTDAEELVLYIDNDGDIYRSRTTPTYKNLAKFMQKGKYDHDSAVKAFMYVTDEGAKKYVRELSDSRPWNIAFPKAVRQEAAEYMAMHFEQLWENGEIADVASW